MQTTRVRRGNNQTLESQFLLISNMATATMENLPSDIIANILLRLPFKSTGMSKCVSKLWNAIISDPKFIITQLSDLSIDPDFLLFFCDRKMIRSGICYVEDKEEEKDRKIFKPYVTYEHRFIKKSLLGTAVVLGNSNGFFTVFDQNWLANSNLPTNPIYIVNPVTDERAPLPYYDVPKKDFTLTTMMRVPKLHNTFSSGFVYQESKKSFKLVLAMFTATDSDCKNFKNEVQICTLGNISGSGSSSITWKKKTGIVPDALRVCYEKVSSAFVNECLHWLTSDKSSLENDARIVSFSVDEEKFGFVPPPGSQLLRVPDDHYKLGVLDTKLAFVKCTSNHGVEIWLMDSYNIKESWVKKYSIRKDSLLSRDVKCYDATIIKLRNNGELLLLFDNEYLVCYDTKSKQCRFVEVEGVTDKGHLIDAAHEIVGRHISLKLAFGLECDSFEKSVLSRDRRKVIWLSEGYIR